MKTSVQIVVRCSPAEKKQMEELAKKQGMSLSQYIRWIALYRDKS